MRSVVVLTAVTAAAAALLVAAPAAQAAKPHWPARGQAAYVLGSGPVRTSARHQHAVPIASVAKLMTAYLVLSARPLKPGQNGFVMTVRRSDVRDWHRRVARGESTVPVRAGERLTERQALAALLLPSANNIAIMLARRAAGSVRRFVKRMNTTARQLGMRHSTYTDPSGFQASTRSTAADQVVLARAALRIPTLRTLVSRRHARIPVAGRITNTDTLLGHDGFAGIKTGSMSASGGCFVFVSHRRVHGRKVDVVGAVLGQRGGGLITAALRASRRLVDSVAPHPW